MTEASKVGKIVTAEQARAAIDSGTTLFRMREFDLLTTVATEPERIAEAERRGAVKALRKSAHNPWLGPAAQRSLNAQADAYERGEVDL